MSTVNRAALAALLAALPGLASPGETPPYDDAAATVGVHGTALREAPSALAPVTVSLAAGSKVTVGSYQGGWVEVTTAGDVRGWLREVRLSPPANNLEAKDSTSMTAPTSDELALAGKG